MDGKKTFDCFLVAGEVVACLTFSGGGLFIGSVSVFFCVDFCVSRLIKKNFTNRNVTCFLLFYYDDFCDINLVLFFRSFFMLLYCLTTTIRRERYHGLR